MLAFVVLVSSNNNQHRYVDGGIVGNIRSGTTIYSPQYLLKQNIDTVQNTLNRIEQKTQKLLCKEELTDTGE